MQEIDQFFEELENLFLEKDRAEYKEIKEDLENEIEVRLSEGESYETILKTLGTPETIAQAFYEDRRLDTALKSNYDVVASEDITNEYKKQKKEKRMKQWENSKKVLRVLGQVGLFFFSSYFFIGTGYYIFKEQTLLFGPGLIFLGSLFLFCSITNRFKKRRKTFLFLSLCMFAGSTLLFYTDYWFYAGETLDRSVTVDINDLKNIDISGQQAVDVSVIRTAETSTGKIELKGVQRKSNKENILRSKNSKTKLLIGEKNSFQWMEKLKPIEVTLYIPTDIAQDSVALNLREGNVNLSHMQLKKMAIKIIKGNIELKDIASDKINIISQQADLITRYYNGQLRIENKQGKTIVTQGQGIFNIKSESGVINVSNALSGKGTISNKNGKNIVTMSQIDTLNLENKFGETIIENQTGETNLTNDTGKVVVTDLRGTLNIVNTSGTIVVDQDQELAGEIKSDEGEIKWVQGKNSKMKFEVKSDSGKMMNSFNETSDAATRMKIQTQTGTIKIIAGDGENNNDNE